MTGACPWGSRRSQSLNSLLLLDAAFQSLIGSGSHPHSGLYLVQGRVFQHTPALAIRAGSNGPGRGPGGKGGTAGEWRHGAPSLPPPLILTALVRRAWRPVAKNAEPTRPGGPFHSEPLALPLEEEGAEQCTWGHPGGNPSFRTSSPLHNAAPDPWLPETVPVVSQ